MLHIETEIKIGDTIWWVHCSNKVYKGIVQEINLCEYQGALYCYIFSPSFKRNPYPVVHYSEVFRTKEEALEFAQYQKENPENVVPRCIGCHYNVFSMIGRCVK